MRDLTQHPIDVAEVAKCLEDLSDEICRKNAESGNVGDMTPVLLTTARRIILRSTFNTYGIGQGLS